MTQKPLRAGVAVLALAVGTVAPAQEQPRPRPSLNLYGTTGLINQLAYWHQASFFVQLIAQNCHFTRLVDTRLLLPDGFRKLGLGMS